MIVLKSPLSITVQLNRYTGLEISTFRGRRGIIKAKPLTSKMLICIIQQHQFDPDLHCARLQIPSAQQREKHFDPLTVAPLRSEVCLIYSLGPFLH